MLVLGVILLLVLMASGVPLFVAFAAGGAVVLLYSVGMSLSSVGQLLYASIDSYMFLSIPLFILAGSLMLGGGSSPPLVRMVNSFLGHVPGGLGLSVVGSSGIFAALNGSNAATAAAIGSILIPEMERRGYPKEYATALTASSGCLGNLIPPSLTAIVYCGIVETSVAKQFLGGVFPGIILMLLLSGVSVYIGRRRGYGEAVAFSWAERGRATLAAIPALFMPVLILGGIYGGIFTVTEAAAVACVYVILIGILIYRQLTLGSLWKAVLSAMRTTANIFLLIATVGLLSRVLIMARIPQAITSWAVATGLSATTFLLLAVFVMLVLGTFLEATPLILVSIPMFMSTSTTLGIDPVLFGTLLALLVGIGQITPPVCIVLYVACGIAKARVDLVLKEVMPFLACQMLVALLTVLFPPIATWLPSLVGVR